MAKEKKQEQSLDNLMNDENIPQANWFKFEKVGDQIKGEVVENPFIKKGDEGFDDQKVFQLKTQDGEEWNVGIGVKKDYIIQRTNKVRAGDLLGFKFDKEVESSLGKNYAKAKSIVPYVVYTEAGNKQREIEQQNVNFADF